MVMNKFAKEMMQYANDAAQVENPYEYWESAYDDPGFKVFMPLITHPTWEDDKVYRRKRGEITKTVSFPKPETLKPVEGTDIYIVNLSLNYQKFSVTKEKWKNDLYLNQLYSGIVHLDFDSASKHAEALNKLTIFIADEI